MSLSSEISARSASKQPCCSRLAPSTAKATGDCLCVRGTRNRQRLSDNGREPSRAVYPRNDFAILRAVVAPRSPSFPHARQAMARSNRLLICVLVVVIGALGMLNCAPAAPKDGGNDYLFCFWNAENLFDDRRAEHENPV